MKTRKQVKQELDELSSQYDVDMSQISSFTTCVHDLPSNEQIKRDFPDLSDVTPLTLGPNGDIKSSKAFEPNEKTHYANTDVAFPFPFKHPNSKHSQVTENYPNFFDSEKPVNNEFMFVALNCAERNSEDNEPQEHDWQMFHDTKRIANTYKLYLEINQDRFKNCYITDALKNTVESDSTKVVNQFNLGKSKSLLQFSDPESLGKYYLENLPDFKNRTDAAAVTETNTLGIKNKQTYLLSLNLFIAECTMIQPKQLIVFGGKTSEILQSMKSDIETHQNELNTDPQILKYVIQLIDNLTTFDHYSAFRSVKRLMDKTEQELWPSLNDEKQATFPD